MQCVCAWVTTHYRRVRHVIIYCNSSTPTKTSVHSAALTVRFSLVVIARIAHRSTEQGMSLSIASFESRMQSYRLPGKDRPVILIPILHPKLAKS